MESSCSRGVRVLRSLIVQQQQQQQQRSVVAVARASQRLFAVQQQDWPYDSSCRDFSTAVQRPLPPNLTIDPESSFAPVPASSAAAALSPVDDDELDDEEQQSLDATTDDDVVEEEDAYWDDEVDVEEEWVMPAEALTYVVPLPDRLHVSVHTLFPLASSDNDVVGSLSLHPAVFGRDPIRVDLLKRAVDYIRNQRRGQRKAVTKTISQVSGSGRKLRAQKGQGRARVGHSRPPHFRGGAKAHGPKNTTNYANCKLNAKVKRLALTHALSQKLKEGNLLVLNRLDLLPTFKTNEWARLLTTHGVGGTHGASALILDHYHPNEDNDDDNDDDSSTTAAKSFQGVPVNVWVANQNLPKVRVASDRAANVYDILNHDKLILTVAALEVLEGRLRKTDV